MDGNLINQAVEQNTLQSEYQSTAEYWMDCDIHYIRMKIKRTKNKANLVIWDENKSLIWYHNFLVVNS